MNFKKSLKDVLVLVIICAVFATVLAAVNSVTAPIIAQRLENAANEAYFGVMEGAEGFETVTTDKAIPSTVKEIKKETSGKGYAIKIETKGYDSGLILIIGVNPDGVVTGATCIASKETNKQENSYGANFIGKDLDGVNAVDLVAGSTMTTSAYRNAVIDAINTVSILGGKEVDLRTEEEKFQDALEAALPGGEVFTKVVLLSALDGIDAVYEADNGKGYVCLIGSDSTGTFIGVDANGKAVGEVSAEHKALAEAAIEKVKSDVTVDVDLSQYDNSLIKNSVNSVKKTGAGTYVIEIKTSGQYTAGTPIVITVVIDASGKIVDAQTVSHGETPTVGGTHLEDGKFNANFIGKNETEAGEVDLVAGVTYTTRAYKEAILNAFNVVKILGGEEVDTRTEEEKFQDALEAALPAGEGQFTKYFRVESVEGFDSIYVADNNAGYVCVIGTDSTGTFIGVGSDGLVVGEVSDENKILAENAVSIISSTVLESIDFTEFKSHEDRNVKIIFRSINSIHKTATGNYIVQLGITGYGADKIVIRVALSADGKILDAQTVSNSETPTIGGVQLEDGAFNAGFIGKNETEAGAVDTVGGATVTTSAYKTAILRVFQAIRIINGEEVDTRTEEQKFNDALSAALPAGEGKFTKYFRVESVEGFDSIYVADNNTGYVCVIGTDSTGTFIGVGSDGLVVSEVSDENKILAETAIGIIGATALETIDFTEFKSHEDRNVKIAFRSISSVQKTATGNYVIELSIAGYGADKMVIRIAISADGKVLDAQTVSNSETPTIGGVQLEDGAFNASFIGKNETEAGAVDTVSGVTVTTSAYKNAILRAFLAVNTIEGGTN